MNGLNHILALPRPPRLSFFLGVFLILAILRPAGLTAAEEAISLKEAPGRPRPAAPAPAGPAPKPALKEMKFSLTEAANFQAVLAAVGPLSPEETDFLEKNRFLLRPKPERLAFRPEAVTVYDEMLANFDGLGGPVAEHLRRPDHARFIGPDVFIHALNRYLAVRLLAVETGRMRELTRRLLAGLYENAAALRAGRTGRSAANWERLMAQLLVPLVIIEQPEEETGDELAGALNRLETRATRLDGGLAAKARTELQRVYQAQGPAPGLLGLTPVDFSPALDYSIFQPRGPYAVTPAARAYFRAATWLRRLGWSTRAGGGMADALNFALALSYEPPAGSRETEPRKALARLKELADFFYGLAGAPGFEEWVAFLMKEAGVPEFTADTAAESEVIFRLLAAAGTLTVTRRQFPDLGPVAVAPVLSLLPHRLNFPRLVAEELTGPRAWSAGETPPLFSALWLPALWGQSLAVEAVTRQLTPASGPAETRPAENRVLSAGSVAAFLAKGAAGFKDRPEDDWFSSISPAWWRVGETLTGRYGSGWPLYMRSRAFAAKELETILGALAELPTPLAVTAAPTRTFGPAETEKAASPAEGRPPAPPVKGFIEPNPDFWRQMSRLVKFLMAGFQRYDLFPGDLEESGALTRFLRRLERAAALSEKELVGEELTSDDYEFIRLFTLDWMAAPLGAPLERPWPESEISRADAAEVWAVGAGAERKAVFEALAEPRLLLVLVGNEDSPRLTVGLAYNHYEFQSPLSEAQTRELWRRAVENRRPGRTQPGPETELPPKNFWSEPLRP
ncbi:MAG: DUF3160 domain-containing protein [Candidatus Adiutrix sp.]|jgi:hypothetical protein|nr:DUF3160 domain-containing protein [Candidatus Adiutrix sp.]